MKTLVLGASPNPQRYSYKAITMLRHYNHEVVAIGKQEGMVADVTIIHKPIEIPQLHTVAIYLSPKNQKEYYDYVFSLSPVRVIFNPGTENDEWRALLNQTGIQVIYGCVLVLLSTHQYES